MLSRRLLGRAGGALLCACSARGAVPGKLLELGRKEWGKKVCTKPELVELVALCVLLLNGSARVPLSRHCFCYASQAPSSWSILA